MSNSDRPAFYAQINRAGGCVTKPEEILSCRVTLASSKGKEAEVAPGAGHRVRGRRVRGSRSRADRELPAHQPGSREILVGIVRKGNSYASVSPTVAAAKTIRLPSIVCIPANEIGRIEARYK